MASHKWPPDEWALTILRTDPDGTLLVGDGYGGAFLFDADRVGHGLFSSRPVRQVPADVNEIALLDPSRVLQLTTRFGSVCGYDFVEKQWYVREELRYA